MLKFYEFFAGGGMARLGLGENWTPLAANDFNPKKQAAYTKNWGGAEFLPGCISTLTAADLSGQADLAWASFPCQDLSLAGKRRGIYADRSGAFWPFWQLMLELSDAGRIPPLIALENVTGMLSANGGKDFADICSAIIDAGFRVGATVIDAQAFVPQSRKRVFVVAVRGDLQLPDSIVRENPDPTWHPDSMLRAADQIQNGWFWLTLPTPPPCLISLAELIEPKPTGVTWHKPDQTRQLLEMMSDRNRQKIDEAIKSKAKMVGTLYRRTRNGQQRAEVRFDIAGCLRTPAGGSSRQTLVIVHRGKVRTRLLSAREAARLMGIPDSYQLPERYNDAYHLAGDGVVVPAVSFLANNALKPILKGN